MVLLLESGQFTQCTSTDYIQLVDAGVYNMGQVSQGTGFPQNASQAGSSGEEQADSRYANPEEALLYGDCCSRLAVVCLAVFKDIHIAACALGLACPNVFPALS